MDDTLLESFSSLIVSQTGIRVRNHDIQTLKQKIQTRVKALRLNNAANYYALLSEGATPAAAKEWKVLSSLITTGESYFFRDQGQIKLLRDHILPDIIQARHKQPINVLSAGCSTGEEIYSVAILLQELTPNTSLSLLGIDLNQDAIDKAKRAVYSNWSFRGVDPALQARYFRQTPDGWELRPQIKSMVTLRCANLIQDTIPMYGHQTVDLIICRNVFIYFEADKIAWVLEKFAHIMRPGSYLLTGHTELHDQNIQQFETLSFPESVVYRMPDPQSTPVLPPLPSSPPLAPTLPDHWLQPAQDAFNRYQYTEAIQLIQVGLNLNPNDLEALALLTQAYANQARYQEADTICHQMLELNPTSAVALNLLAQLAEDQGDYSTAKDYLRRVLFLDPDSIPAYIDLLNLHVNDGETEQAERLLLTVKTMLAAHSPHTIIPYRQGVTVAALTEHVQHLKQRLDLHKG